MKLFLLQFNHGFFTDVMTRVLDSFLFEFFLALLAVLVRLSHPNQGLITDLSSVEPNHGVHGRRQAARPRASWLGRSGSRLRPRPADQVGPGRTGNLYLISCRCGPQPAGLYSSPPFAFPCAVPRSAGRGGAGARLGPPPGRRRASPGTASTCPKCRCGPGERDCSQAWGGLGSIRNAHLTDTGTLISAPPREHPSPLPHTL